MIKYTLKCDQDHRADSWFASASAFDTLAKAGHLSCPVCGSSDVKKALMAPRVVMQEDASEPENTTPVLHQPANEVEQAMTALRDKVEESSDYVGDSFATEARAMHLGDKPERSIYGEARLDQAKELIEDGIPVLPLPFRPKQKLS
ncbi:MAG: DUF1178 family protein [Sulfitobacter sp.]